MLGSYVFLCQTFCPMRGKVGLLENRKNLDDLCGASLVLVCLGWR